MSLQSAPSISFVLSQDHNRAATWYKDVLGLVMLAQDDFATTFRLGDEISQTTLRLTTVPNFKPSMHTVLGFSVPDLKAAMMSLKEKGVEFLIYDGFGQDELGIWSLPGTKFRLAWLNDPEGNNISIGEMG
jgi:catechol-2,3-dioxygenase